MRIAACIEYCGKNYSGWQRQKHASSVQQELESAIGSVANQPVTVIGSGRTDTGVHAIGQIAHFDTTSERSDWEWIRGVNSYLPDDIALIWTKGVSEDFHSRACARNRRYRYVILQRAVNPAYLNGLVTWHYRPLLVEPMKKAAEILLGRHDFDAFRAAGCQSPDPVKEIYSIEVSRDGQWIWLDVCASGFLHHMVRNIVGVLTRIGEGLEPVSWMQDVLDSRDRTKGGVTAPPDGLYFVSADYDPEFNLPPQPSVCRFW